MSKNQKQQQSNAGALASPSRSIQKVLDTQRRFIDDFFPKDGKELKVAVEEIVHDLHAQYLVGYERTSNRKRDFPKITVSITSKSGELLRSIVRVLQ